MTATERARAKLADLAHEVMNAGSGGRNDTLNRAAYISGGYVGAEELAETEAHETLLHAATESGLPAHEARDTITSGLKSGMAQPFERKASYTAPRGRATLNAAKDKLAKLKPLSEEEAKRNTRTLAPLSGDAEADLKRRGLLGGPVKAFTLARDVSSRGEVKAKRGALVFEVTGPDGTAWAVKVRNLGNEEELKAAGLNRYHYLTAGHGAPAWCSPGYGQGAALLLMEGELNAAAAHVGFEASGHGAFDVQGTGGGSGWPHAEGLGRYEAVYVYGDGDTAGQKGRDRLAAFAFESQAPRVYLLAALPGRRDFCDVLGESGPEALGELLAGMLKTAEPYSPPAEQEGAERAGPYEVVGGALTFFKRTNDGPVPMKLCNFSARIVSETVQDDGAEQTNLFTIEGKLASGAPLPRVDVPSGRFRAMAWVGEHWGARAIVYAGQGVAQHLPVAIQTLSQDGMTRRDVYAHTGWRKLENGWAYLSASGAIGAAGQLEGVEVALPPALERHALPEVPKAEVLRSALRASAGLLDVVRSDAVTVALWLGIWRAVLAPADFALWLQGETGQGKSEVAALMLAHFGAGHTARGLPGWHSTANFLEGLAFQAKDALLILDDFNPAGSQTEVGRYHAAAERILRAAGNTSARGRMNADGSLRPEKPPRALLVITAEDVPKGHSARARSLVLDFPRGGMNWAKLSEAQNEAATGTYAAALSGFAAWLAPRLDEVRAGQQAALTKGRALFSAKHKRTPSAAAELLWAWQVFATFAGELGAFSPAELQAMNARILAALQEVTGGQAQHQEGADPVGRFLDLLSALLSSGRAHLADADTGDAPDSPERYGWRAAVVGTGDNAREEDRPQGARIGWVDAEGVYLEPEAVYAEVQKLAQSQNEPLSMSRHTLQRRMNERGLLIADGAHLTPKRTLAGERRRVLHLLNISGGTPTAERGATGASGAGVVPDDENGAPLAEKNWGSERAESGAARPAQAAPLSPPPLCPTF